MLAGERLVHHAVNRLAAAGQRDQRPPSRHAANKRLGPVDRIEHPDIFSLAPLDAEFLANDAVLGKCPFDQGAHGRFGGAVGGGYRVETARAALVFNAKRAAEEWPVVFAENGGEICRYITLVKQSQSCNRNHIHSAVVSNSLILMSIS